MSDRKSVRSVVMLTADRKIDRRIVLAMDSLEAAGWSVTVIAMPLDGSTEQDSRVVRLGSERSHATRENFVLDVYRSVRAYVPMNGAIMRTAKRFAWRYVVNQESFYTKLFRKTASQYSPAVFVANDLPMLPVASELARACGAKLVYDSHELYSEQEFSEREKQQWTEIELRCISACDAVITVNQSIARELERRYGISKVHVILNADRTPQTDSAARMFHDVFGLSHEKKVLLLQGGLSAGRNLEVLVDAMGWVTNPSVVLVILGDGLLLKKLQARAGAKQVAGRVYFHPAVPQNELPTLTMAADAGVIPYQATCLNNYLCTPNKLFEFISAGIPILGTDLPEIRNFVDGNGIGLVGDTRDAGKMASLIDSFFASERQLGRWRANLQLTRRRICWEVEEKKLLKIYGAL